MQSDEQPFYSPRSGEDEQRWMTAQKHSVYHLLDLIAKEVDELFQDQYLNAHRQQMHTAVFEFQLKSDSHTWNIIKTHLQFQQFAECLSKYGGFPKIPVSDKEQLHYKQLEQLLQFFEILLNECGNRSEVRSDRAVQEFLSMVGVDREHEIHYQTWLLKRAGGRHAESKWKKFKDLFSPWQSKFVTITKEGLYYYDEALKIREVVHFSSTCTLKYGPQSTGQPYGIILYSPQIVLCFNARDLFSLGFFVHFLKIAMRYNDNSKENAFKSFAIPRLDCRSELLIDGEKYFDKVYECLMHAQKEVFITGWAISPYFLLKRPDPKEQSRLDRVLSHVASNGVKVNILVFNAPAVALNLDSQFTVKQLCVHKNVKVISHPNYTLIPFMWSHHEKIVIVDREVALVGGMDLFYGRMDNARHKVTEGNQIQKEGNEGRKEGMWPGADYCNFRKVDIVHPRLHQSCSIDRSSCPRMPWHDVALLLRGGAVGDVVNHFVQYWNYANKQLSLDDQQLLVYVGLRTSLLARSSLHSSPPAKPFNKTTSLERRRSSSPQKTFFNKIPHERKLSRLSSLSKSSVDLKNEDQKEEMNFYMQYLDSPSKKERKKEPTAKGRLDGMLESLRANKLIDKCKQVINIEKWRMPLLWRRKQAEYLSEEAQVHQVLRSADRWSLGLEQTEHSILNAYLRLIEEAKHYIYIENQFFISSENKVSETLSKRILRAHEQKTRLKVIIVVPALPGFDGRPDDESAAVFRIQVHYLYSTIRNLYQSLESIPCVDSYLQVYSLRGHALLQGKPTTQIIYVHSKVMVVDDAHMLVGSANINDRSLVGRRDSEVAVYVRAQHPRPVEFGSRTRLVCRKAHELRKALYREHFNLSEKEAADCMDEDVWWKIAKQSDKNVDIYREIFGCYPDNLMTDFPSMHRIETHNDLTKYDLLAPLIKGHAVSFQRHFLIHQNLLPSISAKEYYVPAVNFI